MLFWIFLVASVFFIVISVIGVERDWDLLLLTSTVFMAVSVVITGISVALIGYNYLHANANVAKYQKRYESLVYQYENDFYDNDNDIGKSELINQIEYWNCDLASKKELQRDFWLGIYYPNIYDQFKFVELDKEGNK